MNVDCRYDIIFGRDALSLFKMIIDFSNNQLQIDQSIIAMRPFSDQPLLHNLTLAQSLYYDSLEDDLFNDDSFTASDTTKPDSTEHNYSTNIAANTYDPMDIRSTLDSCTHLSDTQRDDLFNVLQDFPTLFDGILRKYPGLQVHLDIDPTVPPHATRAYSVPHSQLQLFKRELDRLVKSNVLEPGTGSRWISGTFIIPKKDGKARWISDLRALNKAIRRRVYPLPRIQDIMQRRKNYKYLTKIDLSMCFYTYELDEESRQACTIATPFGLYRYTRMPQGCSQGPDIAQEFIERALHGIPNVEAYIDDVAIFSSSWTEHLDTLKLVLSLK